MKKHTSRILSLLLVLALLCSVFTVSAADSKDVSALTEYTQGADTSAVKVFKISSADALTALSTDIKPDDGKGTYNMAGVTFYLANDIKLSGSFIPQRFKSLVDRFGNDPAAMKQAGIAYATDQIIDLYANGICCVHVYSMNKPDVAAKIQDNLSDIIKK